MSTDAHPLAVCGAQRKRALRELAHAANYSHRFAVGAAGSAVAHTIAAGEALSQARDLCDDGEWTAWVRRNFRGSLRTAQRYVRVAKEWPRINFDATNVSPAKQVEAMRVLRRELFGPRTRRADAPPPGPVARVAGPPNAASPALPEGESAARFGPEVEGVALFARVADSLRVMAADLRRGEADGSLRDLAARRILDAAHDLDCASMLDHSDTRRVYFLEAVGSGRVKIGVARDPRDRAAQIAAAGGIQVSLLGHVSGGRERERALHLRFADQRLSGEWFELTDGVRAAISNILSDAP